MKTFTRLLAGLAIALAPLSLAAQEAEFITVASTTSTENSGLFGHILPMFEEKLRHRGARGGPGHRPGARDRRGAATRTSSSSMRARSRTSSSPRATASSAST